MSEGTCPDARLQMCDDELYVLCRMFQSIEKNCKVEGGYTGTGDVTRLPTIHDDTMQVGRPRPPYCIPYCIPYFTSTCVESRECYRV